MRQVVSVGPQRQTLILISILPRKTISFKKTMTSNVHPVQHSVSIPKKLFENQTEITGEKCSVLRPTLEEIEDGVNYLISLHNQKQKKRENGFWAKCISCFGLQQKPLKPKHIDQILDTLKRGVVPMELMLIVSIRKWEKKRSSIRNSEQPSSSSQNVQVSSIEEGESNAKISGSEETVVPTRISNSSEHGCH